MRAIGLGLLGLMLGGMAGPVYAQGNTLLSAYSGGAGGDYRAALRRYDGGGRSYPVPSQAVNSFAPRSQSHYRSWGGASLGWGVGAGRAPVVAPPCGNYHRAPVACRQTTMAWDPSFQTLRAW